jgi:acetyl esterase/lipase
VTNDDRLAQSLEARLTKLLIAESVRAMSSAVHTLFELRGGLADFEIIRDRAYGVHAAQRYDIWRSHSSAHARRPLVLFFHGGGFQQLDRASHWAFAERFARAGAVVINADYRLAPQYPYPHAVQDAALLFEHALSQAQALGADPEQVIVAGTSAGANLALGLALERGALSMHAPRACVLFSGLLQVSDMGRLYRARSVPRPLRARMADIGRAYVGSAAFTRPKLPDARLDPLLALEHDASLAKSFPATFISTGSRDQVLEDALRLHNCLTERGARSSIDVVQGAGHAFQGFIFRERVRKVWHRCFTFLHEEGLGLAP